MAKEQDQTTHQHQSPSIRSDDGYVTKGEFKKGLEDFEQKLDFKIDLKFKALKSEIISLFSQNAAQLEKSFTQKTSQLEEKLFKYAFIVVGAILGGVSFLLALWGLFQYSFFNGTKNHQPIVIYTTPQQLQASPQTPHLQHQQAKSNTRQL